MSTKIYNGLLIDLPYSFSGIRTELIRLAKEEIIPVARLEYTKIVAHSVFSEMDKNAWNNRNNDAVEPTINDVVFRKCGEIDDRVMSMRRTRDPWLDFEFSIVLFPLEDKILAIPYTEQKALLDVLLSKPYVKEYGYWNNTDEPEDMTEAEWKQREIDWDIALGDSAIPAENGFTLQFVREGYSLYPTISDIIHNKPSIENRVRLIIDDEAANHLDSKIERVSDMMRLMKEWKGSDEAIALQSEVLEFLDGQHETLRP